jgi:hypothetical protein
MGTEIQKRVREAQLPLQYSEAIRALEKCQTIDESKYWSDRSDALAAWAKIYKDDQVAEEARRLKIHAYKRMGELAAQLRPGRGPGHSPGAQALLQEYGLKEAQAHSALTLHRAPEKELNEFITKTRKSASSAMSYRPFKGRGRLPVRVSAAWENLFGNSGGGARLDRLLSFIRKHSARAVAADLTTSEVKKAREVMLEVIEWLDEFEQALPKT